MASILDLVQQHLGPQELAQIGQQLGTDPASTKQAIDAALPALVGGMANTAQQPQGAGELQSLMGSHAGLLGSLGSLISSGGGASGGGILGSILGQHQPAVEQGVQQASGIQSDKAKQLLMILAPIVLSVLARRTMGAGGAASTGATTANGAGGGLGDILRQDATQAQQQAQAQGGPMGGILGKILGGLAG
jgi:hypothetical protein